MLQQLLQHIPNTSEIITAIPVIISLIIIEGLLSVDNAMAIAAMASVLPKNQQQLALKLGIFGAFFFRWASMFFVAWIAGNLWIKLIGALYLLYLMCEHLVKDEDEGGDTTRKVHGLIATILAIEFMDLSLSIDNVVAAVAMDKRLWVVCTGVFIGIIAMRFFAGLCIKLIESYPILAKTAFLLVGFVGAILLVEISTEFAFDHNMIQSAIHIESTYKFIGILAIVGITLLYDRTILGRALLEPIVSIGEPILKVLDMILGIVLWPILWPLGHIYRIIKWAFTKKEVEVAV